MRKDDLASPLPSGSRSWTRPGDYVETLAMRRTARHAREGKQRTDAVDQGRSAGAAAMFLGLMAGLVVLVVAFVMAAWPGRDIHPAKPDPAKRELGTAQRGWMSARSP